ncbi:MAG: hypothetical protein JRI66_12825 [Deltaproteobacteria bacterium]|nr:hypothetical protein [Deltaproteobacteria bacterium]
MQRLDIAVSHLVNIDLQRTPEAKEEMALRFFMAVRPLLQRFLDQIRNLGIAWKTCWQCRSWRSTAASAGPREATPSIPAVPPEWMASLRFRRREEFLSLNPAGSGT